MDHRVKAVVVVIPFIVAISLWFMLTAPAIQEANDKSQQVEDKQREYQDLQAKLASRAKLQKERQQIEEEISRLRSSVPKSPDLDLLNIDIEKMCLDSNLEVLFFGMPPKEGLDKLGLTDEEVKEQVASMEPPKPAPKVDPKAKPGATPAKPEEKKPTSAEAEAGLSKKILVLRTMGDYPAMVEFVRKLETYQRVVGIVSMKVFVPKKQSSTTPELPDEVPPSEDEPQGNTKRLVMQLVLKAYYLP